MKKPIFKKWWFWLIIIIVIAAINGVNNSDDKVSKTDNTTSSTSSTVKKEDAKEEKKEEKKVETKKEEKEDNSIKQGMHKVGTDIKAGEYVILSEDGYMQVSKDSTGNLDSIICNENIQNRTIVTVKDGEYFEVKDGKIYSIDKAPKVEVKDKQLPAGMYKVGLDVQPGEYKAVAEGDGYIEVSNNSRHITEGIVSNDNFEGEKYITIKAGQYLKLCNAKLILK